VELIEQIKIVDWNEYLGPECYEPSKVTRAFTKFIELNDDNDSENTYDDVMFSVGNSHGGTYYPAMAKAISFIIKTALQSELEVARNCALGMLIDIYCSFGPELGTYCKLTLEELEKKIKSEVESHKALFLENSVSEVESDRNKLLSKELYDSTMDEEYNQKLIRHSEFNSN
jgi:hypothetical protein